MQISIIIVNYNVKYFLEQCLFSVEKSCRNLEAEIFVVDNASDDGSEMYFRDKFPRVNFIWNKENIGYAKANNQALELCKGEYVLFLNPDTILAENTLDKCLEFIHQQKNRGAMGIRLIDGSGKFLGESKRAFPSPFTSLFKLCGLAALFPHSKIFARYYLGHLDEFQNHEVDVLVGAFMMIPKKVLASTGGFDERFFMYGEDIDLSYRIQKAGFRNYYFSETTAIHFKGESTSKNRLFYTKTFYNAMSLFVQKHSSSNRAALLKIIIQSAIWIGAFNSAIKQFLKNIFEKKNEIKQNSFPKAFIVADETEFDFLFKNLNLQKNILSIVADIETLHSLLTGKNADEIIYCEGSLSFEAIIQSIQQLKSTADFFIHAKNSRSIVGSNDKNKNGICIEIGD